ncbi:30S ribosomal protein S1 [Insulibacter thermoxylanivorax]|uniref:30S ribosomal protein S1 n=1 Tax=Insulibacter thermoxylanivorax TaxID=2749268 RepID=A0A916QC72_9BACL|nr:30S ribosomal protein S1 [Insulibacter thermoxylanivorax]
MSNEIKDQIMQQQVEEVQEQPAADVQQEVDQAQLDPGITVKTGDIVEGKVVKIEDTQVFVDIGYKYDGIIPIRELSALHIDNAADAVELEQTVQVKVISINDDKEQMILSKRAVDSERAWEDLQAKFDSQEIFEVTVADVVKGGLVVDLGVRAFVPASMVERHYVEDFSDYKGKTLRVRIKEFDREAGKVILSQRDVLEEEYEQHKKQVLASLKEGEIIEGTVQRLTNFGAFVDVGGIDGLVHISEMDHKHVEHPSEVVSEGDQVKVKVLKVDPETQKISLSIKATKPGPWELAGEQFKIGDIVTGTVRRLVSFGAFVEVAPAVEGLVHISQIAHRHIGTPHEVLEEGQEVKVKILDMNIAEKRISLSIKETEEAPASAKQDRGSRYAKELNNEHVSLNNQGLTLTLGERFGDQLKKLK